MRGGEKIRSRSQSQKLSPFSSSENGALIH
jgi:hypothetical protein